MPDDDLSDLIARHAQNREMLESYCDADNLPLIDAAYFEHPGLLTGGQLMVELRDSLRSPRRPENLKGSLLKLEYTTPTREFETLAELKEVLVHEHKASFWYRGQRKIYKGYYKGFPRTLVRNYPELVPVHVLFEAIIPSAFREFTATLPADRRAFRAANWRAFKLVPPLDQFAGPLRAMMLGGEPAFHTLVEEFLDAAAILSAQILLIDKIRLTLDDALLVPGTTVSPRQLELISLAQHYEYSSVMVDVTKSIDAAVWFATRNWETGAVNRPSDSNSGAIYRFDQEKIGSALKLRLTGPGAVVPPIVQTMGIFGLADISSKFQSIAARPSTQQGGSLLGLENFLTSYLLRSGMEVFHFKHASVSGSETAYTKEQIRPSNDPALKVFKPNGNLVSREPISVEELGRFLLEQKIDDERRSRLVTLRSHRLI